MTFAAPAAQGIPRSPWVRDGVPLSAPVKVASAMRIEHFAAMWPLKNGHHLCRPEWSCRRQSNLTLKCNINKNNNNICHSQHARLGFGMLQHVAFVALATEFQVDLAVLNLCSVQDQAATQKHARRMCESVMLPFPYFKDASPCPSRTEESIPDLNVNR